MTTIFGMSGIDPSTSYDYGIIAADKCSSYRYPSSEIIEDQTFDARKIYLPDNSDMIFTFAGYCLRRNEKNLATYLFYEQMMDKDSDIHRRVSEGLSEISFLNHKVPHDIYQVNQAIKRVTGYQNEFLFLKDDTEEDFIVRKIKKLYHITPDYAAEVPFALIGSGANLALETAKELLGKDPYYQPVMTIEDAIIAASKIIHAANDDLYTGGGIDIVVSDNEKTYELSLDITRTEK